MQQPDSADAPSKAESGAEVSSHQLGLLHRLLMCARVPRGVTGDVGPGGAHRGLHGGRRAPHRGPRRGAAGKSPATGQRAGVDGAVALLHQLLEFGAFVLEPDFHLEEKRKWK